MMDDPRTFKIVPDRDGGFYLENDYGDDMTPFECFDSEAGAKIYQDKLVKEYLDNYEPRETGDAWTGGFADNH